MPRSRYYTGFVPQPLRLTRGQFRAALMWGGAEYTDDETRIRYVLAAALEERAKERRKEGRPDIAGRLSWLEGQMRTGGGITKRVLTRLSGDLKNIEDRLASDAGMEYGDAE